MASERKALRFHYDLRNTKDEALRMLVRFKQMIDLKTAEAELTNLGQQKRIKELDTQLNEAEDVIVDLRAELKKAHERLKEMRNSHMLQSKDEHAHHENGVNVKKPDLIEQFRCSIQSGRCCNPLKESATSNFNVPSIIIGNTHRIRAIESNLVEVKVISEDELAEVSCSEKELNTEHIAGTLRRSIRKREFRCRDQISSLFKSRTALTRCRKYLCNTGVKFDEHQHRSKSTNASKESTYDEHTKNTSESVVEKQEIAVKESVETKAGKVLNTDYVQAENTDENRLLKYTFSRKRKKVMSSDKCPSVEKNYLARENEKTV
ncbi:uncharacterized protein [Rutidosis leptorrhynchoides]|uniref:uncharacterized protein n=1 Tax=Rutidosis leptorrhynchoides TaxID=125765 RepID=UPI003A996B1C